MMDRQVFSGDVSVQTFGTLRRKVFAKKLKIRLHVIYSAVPILQDSMNAVP